VFRGALIGELKSAGPSLAARGFAVVSAIGPVPIFAQRATTCRT
jgi:hypothetical protein